MSEQKSFLALYLDAPMQSWGYQSRFDRRTTLGYPTRSGVFGMLCAAMGVDWSRTERALARLNDVEMTVLVFEQGPRLWDYHTVGGGFDTQDEKEKMHIVRTAEGKPRGTVVTEREYLEHSRFGVILAGPPELVREIAEAMENPQWGIWFGRKSCIPASLVFKGVFESEEAAIGRLQERDRAEHTGGDAVRIVREVSDFSEGTDTLMDRPLEFTRKVDWDRIAPRRATLPDHRTYGSRIRRFGCSGRQLFPSIPVERARVLG